MPNFSLKSRFTLIAIALIGTFCKVSLAYESELVTTVEPGKVDCFYVPAQKQQTLDVEYQVIDGEQGDLDIDFSISSPAMQIIVAESRKSDNSHRVKVEMDGDYKICFDNSRSMFNSKTVFFEFELENEDDEAKDIWGDEANDRNYYAGLQPEQVYEIQIQDIKDSIAKVRGQLLRVQQLQDQLRAFEARDRNVAEGNFSRVNNWSIIQVVAMVGTGLVQVLMIRSLFDEKSLAHRLWKRAKH